MTFALPEPPSANRWWRKWNNRMVLSKEARDYKALVRAKYRAAPIAGPISVTIYWTRSRKSGDLDKRIGVVLDALQGVAYANDSQIVDLKAYRADNKANAGLLVWVQAA